MVVSKYRLAANVHPSFSDAIDKYVGKISSTGAEVIFSQEHLSRIVGLKLTYLMSVSNDQSKHYRSFSVRKSSGGVRQISEPLPALMQAQRWILNRILAKIQLSDACKSYVVGRGIKDNARIHKSQKNIVKFDLKDFFPSIRINRVFELFYKIGYTKPVSTILANLCTLNGSLPQGAPTSGAISNVILRDFDEYILEYAKENGIRYTRYADDLTFSGWRLDLPVLQKMVETKLSTIGLGLNGVKTRNIHSAQRMLVTGIVVNSRLNVPREYLNKIRQDAYYIEKYGLYGHCVRNRISDPSAEINGLIGRLSHAIHIRSGDAALIAVKEKMKALRKSYISDVAL